MIGIYDNSFDAEVVKKKKEEVSKQRDQMLKESADKGASYGAQAAEFKKANDEYNQSYLKSLTNQIDTIRNADKTIQQTAASEMDRGRKLSGQALARGRGNYTAGSGANASLLAATAADRSLAEGAILSQAAKDRLANQEKLGQAQTEYLKEQNIVTQQAQVLRDEATKLDLDLQKIQEDLAADGIGYSNADRKRLHKRVMSLYPAYTDNPAAIAVLDRWAKIAISHLR